MRRIRMPIPPSQENLRSSSNRSPDGSSTASLTSKLSVRRMLNTARAILPPIRKADDVALRVEPAFGDRDQRSRQGQALRHHHQRLDPLVVGQLARRRRQRNEFAMGARKTLGKIEPQHLVDAFDTDIDQRAVERERLGVEPAARGDRLAVGPEHRRGLDVVEPGHLAALVDDAAGEPAALVADRDEALALCIQPQDRTIRQSRETARSG